jgi:hypothetical protein
MECVCVRERERVFDINDADRWIVEGMYLSPIPANRHTQKK